MNHNLLLIFFGSFATSLHANVGFPLVTAWIANFMFLLDSTKDPTLLHLFIYVFITLTSLAFLIILEFFVVNHMIPEETKGRKLTAVTVANTASMLIGAIPIWLFSPTIIDLGYFSSFTYQVVNLLFWFVVSNLIIEAPIIKLFLRKVTFKRILLAVLIADVISNIIMFLTYGLWAKFIGMKI